VIFYFKCAVYCGTPALDSVTVNLVLSFPGARTFSIVFCDFGNERWCNLIWLHHM